MALIWPDGLEWPDTFTARICTMWRPATRALSRWEVVV